MTYDLVVIGSGPGGYVCAIRAAQLGMKVAVVEKMKTLGGTCLNIGCIPSKALLYASEMFDEAAHGLAPLGVVVSPPKLDLPAMMKHKDVTVAANVNGVAYLFKKNKIDWVSGEGRIAAPGRVTVKGADGKESTLETKAIVIATGSDVARLPGVEIDEKTIVSSTGALSLAAPPKKLIVVGAGVIGLELGSVWRRSGFRGDGGGISRPCPDGDGRRGRPSSCSARWRSRALPFISATSWRKSRRPGQGVKATIEPSAGGEAKTLDADVVLVSVGRRPFTEGLGLEALGVKTERGQVVVDAHFATNVPGIYAIGDVIRGPMLAHKAEDEGVAVAELLAGQAGHVNYGVIPNVVYTSPEVASVGKSEEELKAEGVAYAVGKFPFTANGRARAMRHTDGFVKILADAATDRVLGGHIVGFGAGEMIHEIAVLMEFGGSVGRPCPHLPRASDDVGSGQGGGDGGGEAGDSHLVGGLDAMRVSADLAGLLRHLGDCRLETGRPQAEGVDLRSSRVAVDRTKSWPKVAGDEFSSSSISPSPLACQRSPLQPAPIRMLCGGSCMASASPIWKRVWVRSLANASTSMAASSRVWRF